MAAGPCTVGPRSAGTTRTGATLAILFDEYFHGDNGAGLAASHQAGWMGTIARIIPLDATMHAEGLEPSKMASFERHFQQETIVAPVVPT
jgi:hypothetical protein